MFLPEKSLARLALSLTSLLKLARHLSNLAAVLQKQLLSQVVLNTILVDGLSDAFGHAASRNEQTYVEVN